MVGEMLLTLIFIRVELWVYVLLGLWLLALGLPRSHPDDNSRPAK